jgi:integrase
MVLSDIKSTELSGFFLELRTTHSASLVNQLRGAMSRVMTSALNHQMIADNPVQRTRRLRRLEGDTTLSQQPWTLDECKQAMSVSIGTEMDLFIHLAVLTGARLGEMMGLRWVDIDFEENTLTIQRTLTELRGARSENGVKGVPTFSPPKTAKSVRTLTFGQSLADSLERHKTAQNALGREAGEAWVETDQVFTNAIGQAVWVSNFSAKYRKFLRVNGLRHQNPHALRHAFAINALGLGIDLPSISRALGHASLQITLDIYAKESKDLQNRATEGLSAWFE